MFWWVTTVSNRIKYVKSHIKTVVESVNYSQWYYTKKKFKKLI